MMVKLENILGISFSKNDIHPRISKRITKKTRQFGFVSKNDINCQLFVENKRRIPKKKQISDF
jgi:hypothetical protein